MRHLQIVVAALALLLMAHPAQAQTPSSNNIDIPAVFSKLSLKQGIAYDIQGKQINYITTTDILQWKDLSLEAGYSSTNKIVADLSYDIGGLKKLGLTVPLLDFIDIRLGFHVGLGNISTSNGEDRNKIAYGPTVTIASLKF